MPNSSVRVLTLQNPQFSYQMDGQSPPRTAQNIFLPVKKRSYSINSLISGKELSFITVVHGSENWYNFKAHFGSSSSYFKACVLPLEPKRQWRLGPSNQSRLPRFKIVSYLDTADTNFVQQPPAPQFSNLPYHPVKVPSETLREGAINMSRGGSL